MAHITKLDRAQCKETYCPALATVNLFNRYNASLGTYCKIHGDKALARLQKHENETPVGTVREFRNGNG